MQAIKDTPRTSGWVPSVIATNGVIALRLESTDLPALLRSCLAPLIAQASESGIELRVDVMEQVPRVVIDREKIGWAVVTLVGNALRYVATGGSIIVHVAQDDDELALAVHDDGPGVPPEKLPYLFVRRPSSLHADGLALSLVREVVGAHNGRIEVESSSTEEIHGTSITFRLKC